ncbi:PAN domain-containing protein [Devosia sp. SL43]|uniref:PAN domain-containing protein n=1 Tax=Devosia sp. SL43 TaxID=2806348 RepID=UPI001F190920|nr:PAN domain-containing protein [Devosia sp. SL43]UJW85106.1 hypothetical protein IM737_17105 [Devosia sp. SL43]
MRVVNLFMTLLWLVFAGPSLATADERIGAFLIFDDMQDVILLDGEIGINTPLEFRRAAAARPDAKVLVLGSPGGYVASALIVAGDVHSRGLSTAVPKGFGCYSSCAYIFFAGKERLAEGELGVHQMFGVDDPSGVQSTVSDVIEALEQFDTPTEVVTRMFRTPSEEMYVFSASEIDTLDINRLGPVVLTTANLALVSPPASPSTTSIHTKVAKTDTRAQPQTTTPTAPVPTQSFGPRIALYGGLDFYGNDISSERSEDAVQCATACMEDNQCLAFTFNANPSITRGPNCFLKSGVNRLEGYADALSGVFLPPGNEVAATYTIGAIDPTQDVLARQGLSGADFASSPERGVDSPGECRMACVDETACRAFTYDSRLKQCYLKSSVGTAFDANQLTSGIKRGASFDPLEVIELEE